MSSRACRSIPGLLREDQLTLADIELLVRVISLGQSPLVAASAPFDEFKFLESVQGRNSVLVID